MPPQQLNCEDFVTHREPHSRGIPLHTKILIGLVVGAVVGLIANFAATKSPAAAGFIRGAAINVAEPLGKVFLLVRVRCGVAHVAPHRRNVRDRDHLGAFERQLWQLSPKSKAVHVL